MKTERNNVEAALAAYDSDFGTSSGDLIRKDRELLIAVAELLLAMTAAGEDA